MNRKIALTLALTAGICMQAGAEAPNVNPGMWETTSTVSLESAQFSMPSRTDSSSDCVTAEKIAEGQAFLDENEDCTFSNKEIRADGMDYSMTCNSPDGGSIEMNASMKFNGDTMSGTVNGQMDSPMGAMNMKVEMSGRRTGDC